VALDFDAVKVYKTQQIIYLRAPASQFAFDTLSAFAQILTIVTSQWPKERVDKWNRIVDDVNAAIKAHNQQVATTEADALAKIKRLELLQTENQRLQSELANVKELLEQTKNSSRELLEAIKKQHAQTEQTLEKERVAADERAREKQEALERATKLEDDRVELLVMRHGLKIEREYANHRQQAQRRTQMLLFASAILTLLVAFGAFIIYTLSQQGEKASAENVALNKQIRMLEDRNADLGFKLKELSDELAKSKASPKANQ
jgi:hypothetical protein